VRRTTDGLPGSALPRIPRPRAKTPHEPAQAPPSTPVSLQLTHRRLPLPPAPSPCARAHASLGLYFASRILRKDAASLRAHWAAGETSLAAVYALAVAAEGVDVLMQAALTVGMGATSGMLPPGLLTAAAPPALLLGLPALLGVADKASLLCASVSCGAGLWGEALKAHREGGAESGGEGGGKGGEASEGEGGAAGGGRSAPRD
jgi:uncharacterized membrane protein YgcG